MRFKGTIVLTLLLVAAALYVYFIEVKQAKVKEELKEKEGTLYTFQKDDVVEISLSDAKKTIKCEKKADGAWEIVEPIRTEAEKNAIDSLVSTLAGLKLVRVVDDNPQDLSSYGLAVPSVRVSFIVVNSNDEHTLLIGDKAPVGYNLYVKKADDNKVLTVSSTVFTSFTKELFDLREKRLAPYSVSDITSLEIEPSVKLEKHGDDWEITSPMQSKAENATVNSMLSSLTGLRAERIASEKADAGTLQRAPTIKEFGLDRPQLVIHYTLSNGKSDGLIFGKRTRDGNSVYVKRGSEEFIAEVKPDVIKKLSKDPIALKKKEEKKEENKEE